MNLYLRLSVLGLLLCFMQAQASKYTPKKRHNSNLYAVKTIDEHTQESHNGRACKRRKLNTQEQSKSTAERKPATNHPQSTGSAATGSSLYPTPYQNPAQQAQLYKIYAMQRLSAMAKANIEQAAPTNSSFIPTPSCPTLYHQALGGTAQQLAAHAHNTPHGKPLSQNASTPLASQAMSATGALPASSNPYPTPYHQPLVSHQQKTVHDTTRSLTPAHAAHIQSANATPARQHDDKALEALTKTMKEWNLAKETQEARNTIEDLKKNPHKAMWNNEAKPEDSTEDSSDLPAFS